MSEPTADLGVGLAATDVAASPVVLLPPEGVELDRASSGEGVAPELRARRLEVGWVRACLAVDALMLGGAVASEELGAARAGVPPTPSYWLVAFSLLVVSLLAARRLYAPRIELRLLDDTRQIFVVVTIAAMGLVTMRELLAPSAWTADQAIRLWAFAAVFLIGGRTLLTLSEVAARRAGETLRPTLIIGAGRVGRLTASRLLRHPELGLRPIGFLDKDPRMATESDSALPILGASWDLEDVARRHGVEQVIVTFSKAPHDVLLKLARRCEDLGIPIAHVPRLFDRMTDRVQVEHVVGLPLLTARLVKPKSWQFAIKHAVDRIVAALLLALLAPVLVGAAVAVRWSLGRPILFRQNRVGRDGKTFQMLKFRSMGLQVEPPPAADLPPDTAPGGVEGDDRRTRVGDFLRRTSIDELPQLVNVLRGEMSLIGPRPERPEYVEVFGEAVYRYDDRHRVKAGITGWAQVNGLRGRTSISERAELDNYYVQNWSLWLDVKIVLKTVAAVFTGFRTVE